MDFPQRRGSLGQKWQLGLEAYEGMLEKTCRPRVGAPGHPFSLYKSECRIHRKGVVLACFLFLEPLSLGGRDGGGSILALVSPLVLHMLKEKEGKEKEKPLRIRVGGGLPKDTQLLLDTFRS